MILMSVTQKVYVSFRVRANSSVIFRFQFEAVAMPQVLLLIKSPLTLFKMYVSVRAGTSEFTRKILIERN